MHIGFIEDTDLHGGTQIWVTEAAEDFTGKGHDVTILTSKSGWVGQICKNTAARVVSYDYDAVTAEDDENIAIWSDALKDCDVAICTVHPPRGSFHCSVFAAKCIKQNALKTILVPKTGTIVPEYKRQFYQPDDDINCRVIAITDFTRKALIETYSIDSGKVDLIYQGTEVELFTPCRQRKAEAKKRYPLPDGAWPVLGSVGSFEHRKGQVVLLDALGRIVADQFPNAHLIMVGDGPDEEMLKEKTRQMRLENNVTFFPFTREPVYIFEVLDILTCAEIIVHSCLARKASSAWFGFSRLDYPDRDPPEWRKWVTVQLENDRVKAERIALDYYESLEDNYAMRIRPATEAR